MKRLEIEKTEKERIESTLPKLNEYQRRAYLAAEAKAKGYGGISLVNRETGVSRQTLTEGVKELDNPNAEAIVQGRSRKPGGGRKPIWESHPGILDALKELVSAHTKGDPMNPLIWTNKSLRSLQQELKSQGYEVSHRIVGKLLKKLGYSLQANKKTLTKTKSHPDRDQQFEHINAETKKAIEAGSPGGDKKSRCYPHERKSRTAPKTSRPQRPLSSLEISVKSDWADSVFQRIPDCLSLR